MRNTTPWHPMARPLLIRLGNKWTDEEAALRGLAFPDQALFAAERIGAVERRRHWLTRRAQIRRAVPAYAWPKLGLA